MESILKQEVKLNDGSNEKVFERYDKGGQIFFNCYICRVGKLPGLLNASVHARGKRHLKNLTSVFDARRFREKIVEPVDSKFKILINIKFHILMILTVPTDIKSATQTSSNQRKNESNPIDAKVMLHNLQSSSYSSEKKAYARKKYELEIERVKSSIKNEYSQYRKTLDSHPRYPKEWESFWQRRYKEIKKEGKYNPNDYDYKPEWIKYWKKRIDELMDAEIEDKKLELLKSFGFQSEADIGIVRRSRSPQSRLSPTFRRDKRQRSRSPQRRRRTRSRSWSPPPWRRTSRSPDKKYSRKSKSPRRHDGPVEISSDEDSAFKKSKSQSNLIQEKVTFISVCRLLSALESDVGSLAPKILDLLTKSLQIEKLEPNKSDEVMMTHENSVLLETVAEKLKGILVLGMLTSQKENAINLAIQKIEKLIQQTPMSKPMMIDIENISKSSFSGSSRTSQMRKRWTELLKVSGRNVTELELDVLVEILEEELQKVHDRKKISQIQLNLSPIRDTRSRSVESSNFTSQNDDKDKPFSKEFEDLSDEDLRLLLSNFSELEIEEQNHMVNFLSYLEKTDPERVRNLKSCVNLDNENDDVINDDHNEFNIMASTSKASLTDNLLNFGSSRRR